MIRFALYIFGLFLMASGVALSVQCKELGVFPLNTIPYVASLITGISIGDCVSYFFSFMVLLQILILGRRYKPVNLLQIIVAFVFGKAVNVVEALLGGIHIENYAVQLLLLLMSILLLSIGLFLIISVKLFPLPPDGLTVSITERFPPLPFHKAKIIQDCSFVLLSVVISFAVFRRIEGIREGTVISALLTGKTISLLQKFFGGYIQKVCDRP
jgi:uncharacterized membrane protein YczE